LESQIAPKRVVATHGTGPTFEKLAVQSPVFVAGRFEVRGLVHARGMGDVYRAVDPQDGRAVAMKVFAPRWTRHVDAAERANRELGTALDHPGLAAPLEVGRLASGRTYAASRWIEGKDLAEVLARGPIDPPVVAELLAPLASALDALHAAGIVHRTLSAAKIRLTQDPTPRIVLTGHGAGALVLAEGALTSPASIDYVAPESDEASSDGRVDVYALAILAFRMIAGALPFPIHGAASRALADRRRSDPPTLRRVANRPFSHELEEVLARGLARDPQRRYRKASEFAGDLREALGLPRGHEAVGPVVEALLADPNDAPTITRIASPSLRPRAPAPHGAALAFGWSQGLFWAAVLGIVGLAAVAFLVLAL
jgi:serine/threonine protein kinase